MGGRNYKMFFAGLALTVAGALTRNPNLALAGVTLMSMGLVGTPAQARQEGTLAQGVDPQNALPMVYGKARVGPWIVFQDTRDTARGPNTRVDVVAAFSLATREPQDGEEADPLNGAITGFGSVFFDGRMAFDSTGAMGESFTSTLALEGPDYIINLIGEYHPHLGARDQTADAYMLEAAALTGENAWNDTASDWTSAHTGAGVAYAVFALRLPGQDLDVSGNKAIQKVLPNFPQITAMIRGRRLYDPRDETWKESDNAALVVRDFLLDEKSGMGLTLAQIDEESFKAEANVADEVVFASFSQGVVRKYTANGALDTGRPVNQNLQELLACGNYFLAYEQGKYALRRLDTEVPVTFTLDENNFIGDWSLATGDPGERVNRVIAKYVEGASWDAVKPLDTVAEVMYAPGGLDGGFDVPREINLPLVNNEIQAYQLAGEVFALARSDLQIAVTATEAAAVLVCGDKVRLRHGEFGMDKEFLVTGLAHNPDETVALALRELAGATAALGGSAYPILTIEQHCEVHHGADNDPPDAISSWSTGHNISWSVNPPTAEGRSNFRLLIARADCANFDPEHSSMPGPEYNCGFDFKLGVVDFITVGADQPIFLGVMGGSGGFVCAPQMCSADMLGATKYFRAKWRWWDGTNDVDGDWGPVTGPYDCPDVEDNPAWTADPLFCQA